MKLEHIWKLARAGVAKYCSVNKPDNDMPCLRILNIETAYLCNLSCAGCAAVRGLRPDFMDYGEIERLLKQASALPNLEELYLNYIGEATMHPRFDDILNLTCQLGLNSRVGIITNGTTLNDKYKILIDSEVKRVGVSIDGPKDYNEKWRKGTNHGKVISGLGKLREYRDLKESKTIISVNCVRSRQTEEQISRLINEISSKVDYCFISPLVDHRFRIHHQGREVTGACGYCRDMWDKMYILSDGSVTTCCHDFQSQNAIPGVSVFNEEISEVFTGPAYGRIREEYRNRTFNNIPGCRTCNIYETIHKFRFRIGLRLREGRLQITQGVYKYIF